MARDIKEKYEVPDLSDHGVRGGAIGIVQDRRDDAAQTDRWFVEMQLRFDNEKSAREFFSQLQSELITAPS